MGYHAFRDSLLLMGGDDSSTEVWSPSTGWLAGDALPQVIDTQISQHFLILSHKLTQSITQGTLDGCATRISATEVKLN